MTKSTDRVVQVKQCANGVREQQLKTPTAKRYRINTRRAKTKTTTSRIIEKITRPSRIQNRLSMMCAIFFFFNLKRVCFRQLFSVWACVLRLFVFRRSFSTTDSSVCFVLKLNGSTQEADDGEIARTVVRINNKNKFLKKKKKKIIITMIQPTRLSRAS